MSSFDDRKKAFENKFSMEEDVKFRVNARAVRILGGWAAEKLGISDAAAVETYVEDVIHSDFDEPGVQDVFRKLLKDFADKGIEMTEHHLENEYIRAMDEARKALG